MVSLIWANFTEKYEYIFSWDGKKMQWLEEKKRRPQINNSPKSADEAYFGYERISTVAKTDRVIQHFNSVARHYDFMNTLLSFGIHYAWKRTAVRMLKLAPGDCVLDVCGGTGDLAILAARAIGPAGRVAIYDINRAMIEAGLHKVVNTEIETRLWHVQGNAECISFPDRHFDAAMVGFGIRNVTHMKKGFEEMYRVLKPGGKLMCLEFSKPTWPVFRWLYDFYSFYIMPFLGELLAGSKKAYTHLPESIRMFPLPNELSKLLKKIGFSQITYRRLTNGIAVIHLAVK
ncbi:MAG: bifunctional demethylmenaquinone methyltransferase/2-methoxy-6-polyprenyl-1,4-benzoquinol methylase UbiE [Desulfobacterales bacterium]|jgi:demethylmenaquinone methyltransferase/2-methoxy-6-polyprenyl-1,4-benzoquinol methylase